MILVTQNKVEEYLTLINQEYYIALDTETTGLSSYRGDRLFSIILGTEKEEYYFNFNNKPDHLGVLPEPEIILPRSIIPGMLYGKKYIFAHNAKFDQAMLEAEKLSLEHENFILHCTQVAGRIENNDRLKYSLDALTGGKNDAKSYLDKHKLYTKVSLPGEPGRDDKNYHYDLLPLNIVFPYGCNDVRLGYDLGKNQLKSLGKQAAEMQAGKSSRTVEDILKEEIAVHPVFYSMEKVGIKANLPFVREAMEFEMGQYQKCAKDFEEFIGHKLIDSPKSLQKAFDKAGEKYPLTEKGNPSFAKEALDEMTSPLALMVKDYRKHFTLANTFYSGILRFADSGGVIHPGFLPGGTKHGRPSCKEPNLLNQKKITEKDSNYKDKYLVRRAFEPREDFIYVMIDQDQVEYRMMINYAKEDTLVEAVLAGLDVHTATAQLVNVDRGVAKTINFMLLYGGGSAKLCVALFEPTMGLTDLQTLAYLHFYKNTTVSDLVNTLKYEEDVIRYNLGELEKAQDLKTKYFAKLPNVESFITNVKKRAKRRGWLVNLMGRKLTYPNPQGVYMSPNHLISGSCADLMKLIMVEIHKFLKPYKSRLVLAIYDELVFEIHKSELFLPEKLKNIMETYYIPAYGVPLTCGIDWSDISWQDKKEWKDGGPKL